jgi:sulfite reductase beta subunit-like hemoprotein
MRTLASLIVERDHGGRVCNLRLTGCPHGCARPYVAEVAAVGKALAARTFGAGPSRLVSGHGWR